MSAPDPRGVAIARQCEARKGRRTWRDAPDRRSQSGELTMLDGSIVQVAHDLPEPLAKAMEVEWYQIRLRQLRKERDERHS